MALIALLGAIGMLLTSCGLLASKSRALFIISILTGLPLYVCHDPALILAVGMVFNYGEPLSEFLDLMLVLPTLLLVTPLAVIAFSQDQ